jgi:hypothetical protein
MNMGQEQIDFFSQLNLKVDWRGVIYGKTEGDSKTISGIGERSSEASKEAKVKEN